MAPRRIPAGPVLLGVALVMLLTHAWLARYAHPMADDLSYARKDVSIGAWAAAVWEYLHWNGRYASNFLVLFGPMRGGLDAIGHYRAVPVALMGATLSAAFFLLRAIGGTSLGSRMALSGALLWTVVFMHAMPDLAEGFYWYTGAVTYQLANALLLAYLALLVQHYRSPSSARLLLAAPLLFVVIGFHEVMMLLLVVLHAALVARNLVQRRSVPGWLWLLLAVTLGGAALMMLAPGNAVRSAYFPQRQQLIPSLGMSLAQTGRFLLVWCSSPVVLGLSGLFVLHHQRICERYPPLRNAWGLRPWMTMVLAPVVVFLCVFPSYWSTGILGQYRTLNVACFLVIPILFLVLAAWLARPKVQERLPRFQRAEVVGLLVVITVAGLLGTRNGRRANEDLYTGRAERSDRQLWHRYAVLEHGDPQRTITIPPITDPPKSLYVLELRQDPTFLQNMDHALWFGWKEVHLEVTARDTVR